MCIYRSRRGPGVVLTMETIRLKVAVRSLHKPGYIHGAGTPGIAVEPLGATAWLVEVRVPDESLEGGAWYETLEVLEDEFIHWEQQP